ncbi:hypothetical protein [Rhizosphaericola mali]|uniref:Uncharacterized protein n=1 Tax=Rhizosphaericola mali TaxID=2545455 RepID=A0A5P2FWR9_9BACT|nr:hypothetical protein [Rhizosphaericola mali]QES87625.1 hypothetical protein E0W69_002720 [Rhizosphaericola mali]
MKKLELKKAELEAMSENDLDKIIGGSKPVSGSDDTTTVTVTITITVSSVAEDSDDDPDPDSD